MKHTAPTEPLIRSAQVRAAGTTEAMEFTGIGVPYGERIEVMDWFGRHTEEFEPGSVELAETGAKIYWRHGEIIGRLVEGRDTETGYELDAKISDTTLGRDAYTMLRDGTIDRLSIGFQPLEWREDDEGHITYTKVRAVEFSLVPNPAYSSASVSAVRSAQPTTPKGKTMEPETLTREDLAPVNDALDKLDRQMTLLQGNQGKSGPSCPQYRSMGEFLKAIADGDKDAAEFHRQYTSGEFQRAYSGGTTGDAALTDTFVGNFIKLIHERRRIINKFTTGALPAKGMSVDYVQLLDDGTVVAKQAGEGENLPFGKVTLQRDSAPVETYGGYGDLSLQLVQRSDTPVVDTTLEAFGLRYSKVTNAAVATEVNSVITEQLASFNDATTPDLTAAVSLASTRTTDEWLDLIVDAAMNREDKGFVIDGLMVSVDIFKELIRLKDGDHRLMTVYGQGINQVGRLDLSAVSGDLANITVDLLPGVTGDVATFYDPVAIKTLESPGAPARLQDENIINLTKQFSVHGDMAILTPFPEAILPVNFAV